MTRWSLPLAGRRAFGAGLLLLALWVQTLAPALALYGSLATAAPGLGGVICGAAIGSPEAGATAERPEPTMPGCSHCGLCAAGVVTPTLPTLPRIARDLRWQVVSWPVPPPARASRAPTSPLRARGPPTLA